MTYKINAVFLETGRPKAFCKLCAWLHSEMESGLFTVSQLHKQMKTSIGDDIPVYHKKYLKQAIERHYGSSLFIKSRTQE